MKAFDQDEKLFQYMLEMLRYYFEQMVLGMYDPLQWGWSIQAVWNGYPRICKNNPESEHPFGLNACKWCDWLLTPDIKAAMISEKTQDQHDILLLEQMLKEKKAKKEEKRQRQLAQEAEEIEVAKYENLRERMIAVALEETSKNKKKLEEEELRVCAMEEKIDEEMSALEMLTEMQERETRETKTERKRSRSREKRRSRSGGGKGTNEKKDKKWSMRDQSRQARKKQHKKGSFRKRWKELFHTE
ncbi:hypothetical protein BDZ45DRAFT_752092 [Acephala macrosclerotiorum]|nr:hypothetical protein BDZ45DRAFT_752092 [Acephala macrosclerotiorum]